MKKDLSLLLSAAKDAVAVLAAIDDVPDYRRERVRLALHDAVETVEKSAGPPRCSPHNWKIPVVGDDALVCENCGRALKFLTEITPSMQASIIAAYEQRRGAEAGNTFRKVFHAAFAAERERVNEATSIVSGGTSQPNLPKKKPRPNVGFVPTSARADAPPPGGLPHSPFAKSLPPRTQMVQIETVEIDAPSLPPRTQMVQIETVEIDAPTEITVHIEIDEDA